MAISLQIGQARRASHKEGRQTTYQVLNPVSKKLERLSVKTLEKACGLPSRSICIVSRGIPELWLVMKKLLPGKADVWGKDCTREQPLLHC